MRSKYPFTKALFIYVPEEDCKHLSIWPYAFKLILISFINKRVIITINNSFLVVVI